MPPPSPRAAGSTPSPEPGARSEVKARLSEIAEEVERTHQRVNITRNGRRYVVLMSAEDLESLEATLELLSDPEALGRLAQAQADLAGGRAGHRSRDGGRDGAAAPAGTPECLRDRQMSLPIG